MYDLPDFLGYGVCVMKLCVSMDGESIYMVS